MKPIRKHVCPAGDCSRRLTTAHAQDPLPSWNDGSAEEVHHRLRREGHQGRLARLRAARRAHRHVRQRRHALGRAADVFPAPLRARPREGARAAASGVENKEPFASLLKGDVKGALAGGEPAIGKIVMATHAGMTTEEFNKIVKDWIATAKHPTTKRPLPEMVYQPMLELLAYLRANGFKTFIVSGGGIEFMRPWTEKVYGIPPEQVVGSSGKTKFEMRDGKPVLMKLPEINFIDDKTGKPVGINQHIGRRPIAAFGNSDGDQQMLEWTTAGSGARFACSSITTTPNASWPTIANRTSARWTRRGTKPIAKGWTVVSMKDDWKTIFAFEK